MTDIKQEGNLYIIDEVNNTLTVDGANIRVGIGNNNPGHALSVTGDGNFTANLSAGSNLFLVDAGNSRVTIGTTTAVAGNALTVVGNANFSATLETLNLTLSAGGVFTFGDGTTLTTAPTVAGTIAAGQVAYGASADTIAGNNNLFWDNTNARLGVGTNTPSSSLHVIGVDDDNPEIRVQRTGVTSQYVSIMNEDASGAFISGESSGGNRKTLFLQSVHDGSGSAGSTNISIRTGAASSPTERISILDNDASCIIQSGTIFVVDDGLRVGFTGTLPTTDYTLSASKSAADVSGGLFSTSIGESAIGNTNAGWWLSATGMNTTSKYTPAIKFGSTDSNFTTDSPKYLAGIVGRATETYAADTDGGMAIDFLTFPDNGGANGGPTTRMTIDENGSVGIGTETPAFTLDVNGANANQIGIFRSTDATSRVNFVDSSTSSDTHVGIGAVGNALSLWAGNAVALTAAQSGNLSFNSGKLADYNGAAPTDGQLLIGSTAGGVWEAATLTAGSNVTITNAGGAITIAASGGGGGTPGGNPGDVQVNDGAGGFGAASVLQDIDYVQLGQSENDVFNAGASVPFWGPPGPPATIQEAIDRLAAFVGGALGPIP